jgi:SOS-response transcriptional repressor LexA
MTANSFGDRLKTAFKDAKDADIARKIGVSQPAIKNYMDGRVPAAETLIKISNLTSCSIHWLLTGEGQKWIPEFSDENAGKNQDRSLEKNVGSEHDVTLHKSAVDDPMMEAFLAHEPEVLQVAKDEHVTPSIALFRLVREALIARGMISDKPIFNVKMWQGKMVKIPLVGKVAAGKPLEMYENVRMLDAAQFWPDHWRVEAVEIEGDSMSGDDVYDGDIVYYRVTQDFKPSDMVVTIVDDEGATLKRVRRSGDGSISLYSSNPDHPPMTYEGSRVRLLGVAIGTLRLNRR